MFDRLTPVVKYLLIVNVAVFVVFNMLLNDQAAEFLGLRSFISPDFKPHQIITHMFAHADGRHLFGNMFSLFIFGPMLEHFMGGKRFLYFYMICGFGASVLFSAVNFYEIKELQNAYEMYVSDPSPESFALYISDHGSIYFSQIREFLNHYRDSPESTELIAGSKTYARSILDIKVDMPMVGASGAVFGILMAFALLFPNTELMLLFIPFPIKAKYLVGAYALYEIYSGIQRAQGDNVAHFAHIGGMLIAYILILYWRKTSKDFY